MWSHEEHPPDEFCPEDVSDHHPKGLQNVDKDPTTRARGTGPTKPTSTGGPWLPTTISPQPSRTPAPQARSSPSPIPSSTTTPSFPRIPVTRWPDPPTLYLSTFNLRASLWYPIRAPAATTFCAKGARNTNSSAKTATGFSRRADHRPGSTVKHVALLTSSSGELTPTVTM